MINSKLTIITLLGFVVISSSCNSSTSSNVIEDKITIDVEKEQIDKNDTDSQTEKASITEPKVQADSIALGFLKNLKSGKKLSYFFNDSWLFIYHEDNRCDGSTDGQLDNLKSSLIDSKITLEVKNDGNGWACDKKESTSFDLEFELMNKVADWDRFEIPNYENQEENVVLIFGAGESDYLKLHYDDNNLIVKLEYRSEDPG